MKKKLERYNPIREFCQKTKITANRKTIKNAIIIEPWLVIRINSILFLTLLFIFLLLIILDVKHV